MNIITLDFETFFSDDYTLSKMTTEAYVRDPRFEAHVCGFYMPNTIERFIDKANLPYFLSTFDWSDTAILCHHAAFDGLILSHHYGIKPARWLDTYSMAAYLFPNAPKSLEALAQRFGLSAKTVPYDKVKGKHWAEMDAETQRELAEGCLHDCELTYTIFQKMMRGDY
jgi:DNA polymerase